MRDNRWKQVIEIENRLRMIYFRKMIEFIKKPKQKEFKKPVLKINNIL